MTIDTPALPSSYGWGFVVGQIIEAIADQSGDGDRYPESRPVLGRVVFEPLTPLRKVSTPVALFVAHKKVVAELNDNGEIMDADGYPGVWLVTGSYRVSFKLVDADIKAFNIEVTSAHTISQPLNLATAAPYVPEDGAQPILVPVPAGTSAGSTLTWTADGLAWGVGFGADHGLLTGLTDDDHPQYLNNARGDSRYALSGHNSEDTLAFSVVDEDGRRTWLEAGMDGGPSQYAAEKANLLVPQNEMITDIIYAVVDEDGRRTDIELGRDGRLTQRVIDSVGSRITIPSVPDPTQLVLPAEVPLLVGRESRVYFDSVIANRDPANVVTTSLAGNAGAYWTYTPSVPGTSNLTLTVKDRADAPVTAKTVPVRAYAAVSGSGRRHLAIGDSITRAGNYVASALAPFAGAISVGTRTYNNGALSVEGRGGWSLNQYVTTIGSETSGDSPFLFPVGVSGEKYHGPTEFWRKVCYDDPFSYDFDGFRYIARGWQPSPAPYLYNTSGYPVSPTEGDVVVDATFGEGSEFRQFTSGAWSVMDPQPAVELSFSKYMTRFAAAFPSGAPTSISIMLETNDFFNGISDAIFDTWRVRLDALIASIRAWSATVPIILLLAPTGGPDAMWVTQTVNKVQFDRRMRDAAARIITTYDTPTQQANKVYVASALGAVAPENISDFVHPSVPAGHDQLATPLAGMLAKLITEGVA